MDASRCFWANRIRLAAMQSWAGGEGRVSVTTRLLRRERERRVYADNNITAKEAYLHALEQVVGLTVADGEGGRHLLWVKDVTRELLSPISHPKTTNGRGGGQTHCKLWTRGALGTLSCRSAAGAFHFHNKET